MHFGSFIFEEWMSFFENEALWWGSLGTFLSAWDPLRSPSKMEVQRKGHKILPDPVNIEDKFL